MALVQAYARGDNTRRTPIELIVTTSAEMLCARDHSANEERAANVSAEAEMGAPEQQGLVAWSVDREGRGASIPATNVAETGSYLSREVTRRLACDCGVVEATVDAQGEPLSVGRKSRTIPAAIKRALLLRDRTCRFPGCDHRIFLDGHHLRHWADGGETSLLNTCLLCSTHHSYVHEYGYRISRDESGTLTFFDPRGERIVAVPPRPNPAQLGWPAIWVANAALELSAEGLAAKGKGPLDRREAVRRLVKLKPLNSTMSTDKQISTAVRRVAEYEERGSSYRERDEDAALAHAVWEGGARADELFEWAMAELRATGIDPMAQVPAPYCAPAGWRQARMQG
jgi:hypothetical protein